jgi:signal transduction histidine kinase
LRDEAGSAVRLLAAETDITALKDAQRAQQEEAEVSAALAHAAQSMIAVLDTPALLERVCRVVSEVLHSERSHTWMWDSGLDVYVPVAQHGVAPAQWEFLRALRIPADLFAPLTERFHDDDVITVSQGDGLLPTSLAEQLGVRHAIFMALRRGDRVVGMQSAEYAQRGAFPRAAMRIAHGIAQLASLMWHHARLREDLEKAHRLKSDFVATMSHELRTPLHAIIGFNDLVLDGDFGPITADQEDALSHVRRSARHLREVIDGILDLSRLERGQLPLNLRDVHLPTLTQRVAEEMAGAFDKPGVTFRWELEPALPVMRTDPDKLMVVLKNVIANALKFTAEGHVTVTIGADAECIEFAVADTGIGMAPETVQLIFEPFRQAEPYLTRRFDGLGLGLYVVRRLVDALGGSIEVESELGRGSSFRIRVPLSPPETTGTVTVAA